MCGRFTLRTPATLVARQFDLLGPLEWSPRYNIAPTQPAPVIRQTAAGRTWGTLRWGLVPSWAKDLSIGSRMINARSETVASKPAFRAAFRRRRCLVVADGFYEWQRRGSQKQPYYVRMENDQPFAMAGLWESWQAGEQPIETCTILTTDANALMQPIHDRMPVILPDDALDVWLDPELDRPEPLMPLLAPFTVGRLVAEPVSTYVNSPRHEGPECLAPAPEAGAADS